MDTKAFEHDLGLKVETKVSKFKGIITSRSQCLYGCNRYFITPPVDKDGKIMDGWWVDEADIVVKGKGVSSPEKSKETKPPGGPMSRVN